MKKYALTAFFAILASLLLPSVFGESDGTDTQKKENKFQDVVITWIDRCVIQGNTSAVRIIDHTMNKDPEKTEQFEIEVWSDSENRAIEYTVTETGDNTGVFEATVFFRTIDDILGHRVQAFAGDVVFAKHVVDSTVYDIATKDDDPSRNVPIVAKIPIQDDTRHGKFSEITYGPCTISYLEKLKHNNETAQRFEMFFPAPLKQVQSGLYADEVVCKDPLILVARNNGSPACVKTESAPEIMERGWAIHRITEISDEPHTGKKDNRGDLPETYILDIAEIDKNRILLNPTGTCAAIHLDRLSSDELERRMQHSERERLYFQMTKDILDEAPVFQNLIQATHHMDFPSNDRSNVEIGLRELVDYELFLMDKAIEKYADTREDYFLKLDGNLDEKLSNPKPQGFSNEFAAPLIVYDDKAYVLGKTVFWVADEHEPRSLSVKLQDKIDKDRKFVTMTDEDLESIPKIKHALDNIGTTSEEITAIIGMGEEHSWSFYLDWVKQKSIEQFGAENRTSIHAGFVYDGEYFETAFSIC